MIEDDGEFVRGFHSIDDNVNCSDGDYAAHTLGTNTGSIGISACCMANATPSPLHAGPFPMTEKQWLRMADVAADLAVAYHIPVTPQTILGHGEVEKTLGHKQKGKWDPMALPWKPQLSSKDVGDLFRAKVKERLGQVAKPHLVVGGEGLPMATALLNGTALPRALFANEDVLLPVKDLPSIPSFAVAAANNGGSAVTIQTGPKGITLPILSLKPDDQAQPAEDWVPAGQLADALGAKLSFDRDRNVVALTWA